MTVVRSHRRVGRPASLALLAVTFAFVLAACGGGGGGDDEAYVEPKGEARETICIAAKNFSFTPDDITTEPGIVELELVGEGGIHDLVFDDGAYPGFMVEVQGDGTDAKKIDLERGTFTFYCNIPGHRAGGMEGTLTVE